MKCIEWFHYNLTKQNTKERKKISIKEDLTIDATQISQISRKYFWNHNSKIRSQFLTFQGIIVSSSIRTLRDSKREVDSNLNSNLNKKWKSENFSKKDKGLKISQKFHKKSHKKSIS